MLRANQLVYMVVRRADGCVVVEDPTGLRLGLKIGEWRRWASDAEVISVAQRPGKGKGLNEGAVAECALAGVELPDPWPERIDRVLANPGSHDTAGSDNINVALALAGSARRHPLANDWFLRFAEDRLAGPIGASEDGTGQYQGGFVTGCTGGVIPYLTGYARDRCIELHGAQLALLAACSWDGWVCGVGERVQGKHGGPGEGRYPPSLILRAATGRPIDSGVLLTNRDPLASLRDRWVQERLWPFRVWHAGGLASFSARRLSLIAEGNPDEQAVETIALIRLRHPWTIERYERGLLILVGSGSNGNSVGCAGCWVERWREPVWFDVRERMVRQGLPPWTSALWRRDDGVTAVTVSEARARERDGLKSERGWQIDTSRAGRLLCTYRWDGGNAPGRVE